MRDVLQPRLAERATGSETSRETPGCLVRIAPWMWLTYVLVGLLMEAVAFWKHVASDTLTGTIVMLVPVAIVLSGVAGLAVWLVKHFREAEDNRGGQR